MNTSYNTARPLIMHIDLNSCFATVEQQSRPLLRNRPVAVMNRRTEHTAVVTASYEAKAKGVKVGMRYKDALKLVPDLVALESDPAKYRYVYHRLLDIMSDYSAHVTMKSIDEGVIDFTQTTDLIRNRPLEEIGLEIKRRLREEIGNYMRCNVGIGTNRFLAKTAAGLHKPDGLDVITHENLRAVLGGLKLTDLTGIASHNEHRLNGVGIYTPLQFLDADPVTLRKMVFKSIVGEQWHQRLRGWEVDDVTHDVKTVGRQYVLEERGLPLHQIAKRLHNLCESVGSRLRSQDLVARGVSIYVKTDDRQYWHTRHMSQLPFYSDQAIYAQACSLLYGAPAGIREIGVSCYELSRDIDSQLSLFGDQVARDRAVTEAVDVINHRFGERTIHSADTLETQKIVKQKIPFGSTRYL
jgi:DNA polymerase IV